MFDTHCHLNFKRFENSIEEVVARAHAKGVTNIIVPGTDLTSSAKALEIAQKYSGIYAALGIHPHHAKDGKGDIRSLETLLQQDKAVAVGEVGLDRHVYTSTKYTDYEINEEFMAAQKSVLIAQIKLAAQYHKSLILHTWEAKKDMLETLSEYWDQALAYRTVFHCCEPDKDLLQYAKKHHIFIGADGDVTYLKDKQTFIQEVPLEMLVLETDSPYLLPEPLRSQKLYPNEPCNIPIIALAIARMQKIQEGEVRRVTTENARTLFSLPEDK